MAVVGFGLAALAGGPGLPLGRMLAGAAIVAGPWLITWLASPASIGFGDVKLSAGLGLYVGWISPAAALTALVAAILVAGLGVALNTLRRRGGATLAFGPPLVVGAVVAVAANADLIVQP